MADSDATGDVSLSPEQEQALAAEIARIAALPQFPTGEQMYDALMGIIEPQLTTKRVGELEGKELSEDDQARFAKARARYSKALEEFATRCHTVDRVHQREGLRAVEQVDRGSETDELSALEEAMKAAPDAKA